MQRRDFFQRVVGGIVAAIAAPFLPNPALPRLKIRSQGDWTPDWKAYAQIASDPKTGISMRFITKFDPDFALPLQRFDIMRLHRSIDEVACGIKEA